MKIIIKYVLTDEALSTQLSGNKKEEYQVPLYKEEDYKALIESHRPQFSNGLEKWL
jgi:hypothetical protein